MSRHGALWAPPLFTDSSTARDRTSKSHLHPYSFLASNFPSQTSKPPQSLCTDAGFPSALFLNSGSHRAEHITKWAEGEESVVYVPLCAAPAYTYYTDDQTSWMAEIGHDLHLWHLLTCAEDNKWQLLWMQVIIIRPCVPAIQAEWPVKSCDALPDGLCLGRLILKLLWVSPLITGKQTKELRWPAAQSRGETD